METYKTDNTPNEVINDQNSENDKNLKELTLDLQKVKISIESEVESETTITDVLRKAAQTTTAHGFPRIALPAPRVINKIQRYIWIILTTLSMIICFCMIHLGLEEFLAYDFLTSIKEIQKPSLIFPAFIFCAWNNRLPVDQHIFDCRFQNKDCSKKFERVVVLGNGFTPPNYCIRLNKDQELISKQTDYDLGLVLSFLIPKNSSKQKFFFGVYKNSYLIRSDEIRDVAKSGEAKFIKIKKEVKDKLSKPYNQCEDKGSDVNTDSEYRQILCYRKCMLTYIEKACNCNLSDQYSIGNTNQSNKCSRAGCYSDQYEDFDYASNCDETCPRECDSEAYDMKIDTLSTSSDLNDLYGSKEISDFLSKNDSKTEIVDQIQILENLLVFKINYAELSFTLYTEIPKVTFWNFISGLGGTFGLFLGVSFLSFVEFFEMIALMIWVLQRRLAKRLLM